MPGYDVLGNKETETLLNNYLIPVTTVIADDFNTIVETEYALNNPFKYYVHPEKNLIIITTPIAANNFEGLLPHLNDYFNKQGLAGKKILLGLDGQGATEKHIVTAYISEDRRTIEIYDPKASNAKRFFSGKGGFGTLLLGLFRSLNPFPKNTLPIAGITANYHALGTQSFFDGVSCGYHNVANILACKELIENDEPITRENILEKTVNPVKEVAGLLKENALFRAKVDSDFLSFIEKAWLDTVMPLENHEQREKLKFQHYFLGWPNEGTTAQKIVYFASLSFIVQPVINLIRRPIEFLPNVISETANYLKNSLINWAPTNLFTQYLRSGLMLLANGAQGLFKTAYLILRTVTSPVTSFQAAQAIENPRLRLAMSILSVASSIAGLAALAVFVAPGLLGAIPGTITVLQPLITTLAYPFSQLFGFIGVILSPTTAAVATLIVGTGAYTAIKTGAEQAVTSVREVPSVEKSDDVAIPNSTATREVVIPEDSNVTALFKKNGLMPVKAEKSEIQDEPDEEFTLVEDSLTSIDTNPVKVVEVRDRENASKKADFEKTNVPGLE